MIATIPFAEYKQALRIIAEEEASEYKEKWRRTAFIAWQIYTTIPLKGDKTHMEFDKYLRRMGIEKPRSAQDIKDRAAENFEAIMKTLSNTKMVKYNG